MKRIERNTYNSIRRNTTANTINVEIPVEYSHEARQAIHEYLTINGMRVTGINWNSILECYCIHWEPARTETAEAIRRQQENADIDDVTNGMEYSDWTWNGYRKPAEAPQEAPAADAEQQPTETENAPQAAQEAATGRKAGNTMSNYMNTDYTRNELITLALKIAMKQARAWQNNAINECDADAAEHYENLANAYRAIIEEIHAQQPQEAQEGPQRPRT